MGAAPLPADLEAFFFPGWDFSSSKGYGLTVGQRLSSTLNHPFHARQGSVGKKTHRGRQTEEIAPDGGSDPGARRERDLRIFSASRGNRPLRV